MPTGDPEQKRFDRLAQRLGLVYGPAGRGGKRGQSRYGLVPGKRLDEDIDDLRARVEALEAHLSGE